MKIGYIGIGLMGEPMAGRLLAAGFDVGIWGRTPGKLQKLYDAGATRAESPASLASNVDVLFLCVSDTAAVEDVMFGSDGAVRGLADGAIVIDMSSIEPGKTVSMADDLAERTGARWIDAPVSGGIQGAENGTLAIMCGGREPDFERVGPALKVLGSATLVGPSGSGQSAKLINQLVVACTMTVVAEATALAEASGIDVSKLPGTLAGGRADSPVLQQFMPRMAQRDQTVEGTVRTIMKDIGMITERGKALKAKLPMLEQASKIHEAVADMGHADGDNARIIDFYT